MRKVRVIGGNSITRSLQVLWGAVCLAWCAPPLASGAYIYTLDPSGGVVQFFNDSATTETEDNFVANSFTVVPGATELTAVRFLAGPGSIPANQPVTVAIYTGSSLTDPQAGGGLTLVATTSTTLAAASSTTPTFYKITLNQPVDLPVGQVFYAGVLLPEMSGNSYPFGVDVTSPVLGQSFFDVGPTMGASYNPSDTANLTVLGGTHPVVGAANMTGDLVLTVYTPEPGAMAALALAGGCALRRTRRGDHRPPAPVQPCPH